MIGNMLSALFGCRHRRLTRPITPVHKPGAPSSGTYVACLECGRHFQYDVTAMRVGAPLPPSLPEYRPISGRYQVQ
jgi:hypothetical protein